MVEDYTMILRDAGISKHLVDFMDTVRNNGSFMEKFMKLHNFVQVLHLKSRTDDSKHFIIANTHLYSQIEAGSIRFVQMVCAIKHIEYVYNAIKRDRDHIDVAIIICGDLNSTPNQNINTFALTGTLPKHQRTFECKQVVTSVFIHTINTHNFI